MAQAVRNPPAMQETQVRFHPWVGTSLEKGTATHSSNLAWRTPRMAEPCGLQSMGSQRIGCDLATNTHICSQLRCCSTHCTAEKVRSQHQSKNFILLLMVTSSEPDSPRKPFFNRLKKITDGFPSFSLQGAVLELLLLMTWMKKTLSTVF